MTASVMQENRAALGRWSVFLLAVGVGFAPLLADFGLQAWGHPSAEMFLILLGGATWLGWRGWRTVGPVEPTVGHRRQATVVAILAWLLLAAAAVLDSPNLGIVALVLALAAWGLALGGPRLVRAWVPALGLLGCVIFVQMEMYQRLAVMLQERAAQGASALLDLVGLQHLRAGTVIETGSQRFLIEEGCSGIRSLSAIFAGTLFFALGVGRSWFHAAVLVLLSALLALLVNILRVVLVIYLAVETSLPVTSPGMHDAIGLVVVLLTLLLVMSADQLLLFFLAPNVLQEKPSAPDTTSPRKVIAPGAVTGFLLGLAFILLGAAQAYWCWPYGWNLPHTVATLQLQGLRADTLPATYGPWQQLRYETKHRERGNPYGENSQTWFYRGDHREAAFSLDYPFPHWHDLTTCYRLGGWIPQSPTIWHGEQGQDFVKILTFSQGAVRHGTLWFTLVDEEGQPVPDPGQLSLRERWAARWQDVCNGKLRWRTGAEPMGGRPVWRLYQVQLFVESNLPLNAAEQAEGLRMFLSWRDKLRHEHFRPRE